MDYFMMQQFVRVEALNNVMSQLCGRYSILSFNESKQASPNANQIQKYKTRAREIMLNKQNVFNSEPAKQEQFLKDFVTELKALQ